jgi:hypothetical protein
MPSDRSLDRELLLQRLSAHPSPVDAPNLPLLYCSLQLSVNCVCLCDQHKPARLFIQPMHDSRTKFAALIA